MLERRRSEGGEFPPEEVSVSVSGVSGRGRVEEQGRRGMGVEGRGKGVGAGGKGQEGRENGIRGEREEMYLRRLSVCLSLSVLRVLWLLFRGLRPCLCEGEDVSRCSAGYGTRNLAAQSTNNERRRSYC